MPPRVARRERVALDRGRGSLEPLGGRPGQRQDGAAQPLRGQRLEITGARPEAGTPNQALGLRAPKIPPVDGNSHISCVGSSRETPSGATIPWTGRPGSATSGHKLSVSRVLRETRKPAAAMAGTRISRARTRLDPRRKKKLDSRTVGCRLRIRQPFVCLISARPGSASDDRRNGPDDRAYPWFLLSLDWSAAVRGCRVHPRLRCYCADVL